MADEPIVTHAEIPTVNADILTQSFDASSTLIQLGEKSAMVPSFFNNLLAALAPKLFGIGFIVAGVFVIYLGLGWHNAASNLKTAEARAEILTSEKAVLEGKLDQQSQAVANLAAQMDRQRGASLNALAKAKAGAPSTEAQVTALLNKAVNTDNFAACLAADKALLDLH